MGLMKWLFLILSICIIQTRVSSNSFIAKEKLAKIPAYFLNLAKQPKLVDYMVRIRRILHEYPELGYEEFETSKLIRTELDKMGIDYRYPAAVTGVVGFIGTGKPPFVAIRADMDALAMEEGVEWEHKSKVPGKMHGCGHDAHVSMLLGAAMMLQDHRDEIQGTVVLVFQPAEEGGGGAKKMLDEGMLENVEAIFGLHVSVRFPIGSVSAKPGPVLAASGFFEAVISGKGGHAAIPHQVIDPIVAASNVIISLQHLVSREADPLESQVVTVARLQGGGAFNVIPDSVTIGGTFRAFSKEGFAQLKHRIKEVHAALAATLLCCVVGTEPTLYPIEVIIAQAKVHRCNASVDFNESEKPSYPPTVNNKYLHQHFERVANDMLGAKNVYEHRPLMGAEDFSFFAEAIPGCFFFMGMQNQTHEKLRSSHSPYFKVNEDVLPYGAAFHASLVTRYLLEHQTEIHSEKGSFHDEF